MSRGGKTKTQTDQPSRAVGYLRVSTTEQADSGAVLAAQRAAIEAECTRRGWELVETYTDAASGKSLAGRDALCNALAAVEGGAADVLIVSKLDRLSRSLLDFAGLMGRAQRKGWVLVALDLGIDLSTPAGEFLASVMGSAAQWERRILGVRTREGLAAKKAAGVRLGRRSTLPPEVIGRITSERAAGRSMAAIARDLTTDQVPTGQGGRAWYASSVQAVLRSAATSTLGSPGGLVSEGI
jgi:DNA invertase Pin-like site-specific DNA recombinase